MIGMTGVSAPANLSELSKSPVNNFRAKFKKVLSNRTYAALAKLGPTGLLNLKKLERVLKVCAGKNFQAGQPMMKDALSFGVSNRRLKSIRKIANSLDTAHLIKFEPVFVNDELKLISVEDKSELSVLKNSPMYIVRYWEGEEGVACYSVQKIEAQGYRMVEAVPVSPAVTIMSVVPAQEPSVELVNRPSSEVEALDPATEKQKVDISKYFSDCSDIQSDKIENRVFTIGTTALLSGFEAVSLGLTALGVIGVIKVGFTIMPLLFGIPGVILSAGLSYSLVRILKDGKNRRRECDDSLAKIEGSLLRAIEQVDVEEMKSVLSSLSEQQRRHILQVVERDNPRSQERLFKHIDGLPLLPGASVETDDDCSL